MHTSHKFFYCVNNRRFHFLASVPKECDPLAWFKPCFAEKLKQYVEEAFWSSPETPWCFGHTDICRWSQIKPMTQSKVHPAWNAVTWRCTGSTMGCIRAWKLLFLKQNNVCLTKRSKNKQNHYLLQFAFTCKFSVIAIVNKICKPHSRNHAYFAAKSAKSSGLKAFWQHCRITVCETWSIYKA